MKLINLLYFWHYNEFFKFEKYSNSSKIWSGSCPVRGDFSRPVASRGTTFFGPSRPVTRDSLPVDIFNPSRILSLPIFYFALKDSTDECVNCNITWNSSHPSAGDFLSYLPMFLKDIPGVKCAKGYAFNMSHLHSFLAGIRFSDGK